LGIISSGTFYEKPKSLDDALSTDINRLFDNNYEGLNIVRALGGIPAVLIFPHYYNNFDKELNFVFKESKNNGVNVLKIYSMDHHNLKNII